MENTQVSNDATKDPQESPADNVEKLPAETTDSDVATTTLVPTDSSGDYVVPVTEEQLVNQDLFPARGIENILAKKLLTVPGTVNVDAKLAGLGGRGFPRVVVQLDPVDKVAAVDATVAVTWPSPVTDVAAACREVLKETILAFTGYATTRANVIIGHAEPGPRVTAEQIANRPVVRAQSPRVTTANVRQPVVSRTSSVHSIALLEGPDVREIRVPAEPAVRAISTPDTPEVRRVDAPEPAALRAINVSDGLEVTSVDIPEPMETRAVTTREQSQLTPVETAPGVKVSHVTAPEALALREASFKQAQVRSPEDVTPSPLREPTFEQARVRTPEDVTPSPLRPVNEPEPAVINVEVPEPRPLRTVSRGSSRLRPVEVPPPPRLKDINVASTPLAKVTLKRSTPLKHVEVPQPTPLRYIEVSPANATKRKKG